MFPLIQIGYYCYSANSSPLAKTYNSTVYVGTHMLTKKIVAIKEIYKQKKIKSPQQKLQVELLVSEIDTLFELQKCQNILHLLDVYQTEKHVYIITEYYKEGDLQLMLASLNKRLLTQKQALQYITKIYRSYMELYKRNILHRDLKLANVFLSENKTILADFGYCIKYDPKKNDGFIKIEHNVGSPLYMAPQTYQQNLYSIKSDIWALGIMFYQLLTKQTPWSGINELKLFNEIKKIPIQRLIPEDLSQLSKAILKNSLQYDPNKRMGFEELLELLVPIEQIEQSLKCESQTELNFEKQSSDKSSQCSILDQYQTNASEKLKLISNLPNKFITNKKRCALLF